jgi:hypothetical protein
LAPKLQTYEVSTDHHAKATTAACVHVAAGWRPCPHRRLGQ